MNAEAKSAMTPAEMVSHYIRLRDYKTKANEEFKKSMEKVNAAMDKLEGQMLSHLNATGADSIACSAGTVYKSLSASATVDNRDAFVEWVLTDPKERFEAVDVKANKTFVKDYATEKGEIPPGVKFTQIYTVGVRRK